MQIKLSQQEHNHSECRCIYWHSRRSLGGSVHRNHAKKMHHTLNRAARKRQHGDVRPVDVFRHAAHTERLAVFIETSVSDDSADSVTFRFTASRLKPPVPEPFYSSNCRCNKRFLRSNLSITPHCMKLSKHSCYKHGLLMPCDRFELLVN